MIYVVFIENDKTQESKCGNTKKELMPRSSQIGVDDSGYDVKNKMASAVLTLAATSASTSKRRLSTLKHVQTVNEKRRSFEDNLAKIFHIVNEQTWWWDIFDDVRIIILIDDYPRNI